MNFTPAQFRDAVGVTQETLRYWRKTLPIFQGRAGYAPVFSIADLVAGAVIKRLRIEMGVAVANLVDISESLGRACSGVPWATMMQGVLILDIEEKTCVLQPAGDLFDADTLKVLVPLQPILAELSAALVQPNGDVQHPMYFPPREVPRPTKRRMRKA